MAVSLPPGSPVLEYSQAMSVEGAIEYCIEHTYAWPLKAEGEK